MSELLGLRVGGAESLGTWVCMRTWLGVLTLVLGTEAWDPRGKGLGEGCLKVRPPGLAEEGGACGSQILGLLPVSCVVEKREPWAGLFLGLRGSLTYIHSDTAPARDSTARPRLFAAGGHADCPHGGGERGWAAQFHQHEVMSVCGRVKPGVGEGLGGPDLLGVSVI